MTLVAGQWYDIEGQDEPLKYLGMQGGSTHRFRTEWNGSYFLHEDETHRASVTKRTEWRFQPAR